MDDIYCITLDMKVNCFRKLFVGNPGWYHFREIPEREFMMVSESEEIEMGREYDPEVVAQYGLYNDDELQEALGRGQKG
jgi:hypothetical protein